MFSARSIGDVRVVLREERGRKDELYEERIRLASSNQGFRSLNALTLISTLYVAIGDLDDCED